MQIDIVKSAPTATGYRIACITNRCHTSAYLAEWRTLLAQSRSCEKIYQSPEFFHYLGASRNGESDRFELFAVHDDADRLLGVLPLRWSVIQLEVRVTSFIVYSHPVKVIRLLGSLPLLGTHDGLRNKVLQEVLQRFPDQDAILLQACPAEEQAMLGTNRLVRFFVLHGWRVCHTIPIPDRFDVYLQKCSAKRRYNTARQCRLLKKELGELCLQRVDSPAHVKALFECLTVLAPWPDERRINEDDYTVFAASEICLSYTLRAGDEWVAAVLGSRYGDTWHVHRIHFAQKYRHLSAGAVAMHLAIEDVIEQFHFSSIDFGFGEPSYKFASTHVLKKRATVLVTRKQSPVNALLWAFVTYDNLHTRLGKWALTAREAMQAKIRRRPIHPH